MKLFGGDMAVAFAEQQPRQIQPLPRRTQARLAQLGFDVERRPARPPCDRPSTRNAIVALAY